MINRKAIVCYLTLSGNTEEVAEIAGETLQESGYDVELYRIGFGVIPDLSEYDLILLGTYTWDRGSTPDYMKDFVIDVGYKPNNVAVFGTGDTQFGGDALFCKAVDKLAKFYHSEYETLKVEQSPRGSQVELVEKWIRGVIVNDSK